MDLLEVVGDPLVRDVPFAVVARRDLGEALCTEQRAAVEELIHAPPFGRGGGAFITAGMLVSVFGALNAQMMSGTRVSLAVGQRRELPGGRVLGAINPRFRTPINSLIF